MSSSILFIFIFIAWVIIKNIIKQSNMPGEVSGKYKTPPIVNQPQKNYFEFNNTGTKKVKEQKNLNTDGLDTNSLYPHKNFETNDYDMRQSLNIEPATAYSKETIIEPDIQKKGSTIEGNTSFELASVQFTKENILSAVIFSEVLGTPKSKRKY